MRRSLNIPIAVVALVGGSAVWLFRPQEERRDLPQLLVEIERINALCETLAATFAAQGVPATRETFLEVCRPVGMALLTLADSTGWTVQQLAVKYRNPLHRADPEAERIITAMEQDTTLMSVVLRTYREGVAGFRYLRRITVQPACLACHGARDARPEFIKSGYPQDRAYDFRVGDLRGVYSVFLPD